MLLECASKLAFSNFFPDWGRILLGNEFLSGVTCFSSFCNSELDSEMKASSVRSRMKFTLSWLYPMFQSYKCSKTLSTG